MTVHAAAQPHDLIELVRLERRAFAAQMRLARAVLGWSQSELGLRVGLTQRAIHKLEQGETEPRRMTLRAIEALWREQGIEFRALADGGFAATIRAPVLDRAVVGSHDRRRRGAQRRLGMIGTVTYRD